MVNINWVSKNISKAIIEVVKGITSVELIQQMFTNNVFQQLYISLTWETLDSVTILDLNSSKKAYSLYF